ncbi:T9SS type A sorting domain-containing protein [Cytophaga hutchinsonii]|uniref:CHU large protein uncharacterized n=1 Tax=Cytophaga hutchinsonii (strain ATCC 33406 / DSM 1761 / CIP 103989 / NBRC 15051 / NCIMB 9469 / D465) TaxID=269798 RepID=A0A6N4SVT3_CYTH3|nr:T9SS type A sorting domain-containing protein [Cytophaga hutchinsonii]ABG60490.1 CHU large protein; uncharacterized [Cytophaga hutchinsonii ATCC 33406]SFX84850.1 Por secretion system C-terminal sorting domain-containing protein [Cytophaga hutchinsonii ATCC 33406]
MKKILLAVIIFVFSLTMVYAQCTKPVSVTITTPETPICLGTPLSLSATVLVSGTSQNGAFTFSWIKNSVAVTASAPITIPANTVTAVPMYTGITGAFTDAGTYTLRVEDGNAGNASCYTEANFILTVHETVTAGSIVSAQTICSGENPAAFTSIAAATGGTGIYSYVWEKSMNGAAYADISPAVAAETFDEGVVNNNGTKPMTIDYRRKATSGICPQVVTAPVRITVNPAVIAGVVSADQTICSEGDPAAFTVTTAPAGGTGVYTYQWEIATAGSGPYTNIAAATAATYDAPSGITGTTYYRRADASGTCATAHTNLITVTVQPAVLPGIISADQTICISTVPSPLMGTAITGGSENSAATYMWESSTAGFAWTDVTGENTKDYSPQALTADTYFRRKDTKGICPSVTSNIIKITVDPEIVTPVITGDQTICAGTAPNPIGGPPVSGGSVATPMYIWEASRIGGSGWVVIQGATSKDYHPGILIADMYYRRIDTKGVCKPATSNIVKITVPTPVDISSDKTVICKNGRVTFTATVRNGDPDPMFEWFINDISQGTPSSSPEFSTTNILSSTDKIQVILTSNTTGCSASAWSYIHVSSGITPGTISSDQTICYNTSPNQITQTPAQTDSYSTPTYTWETSASGITGSFYEIPGATTAAYNSTLPFTTDTYIRRVATDPRTSAPCNVSTSNTIKITVAPLYDPGAITGDETLCEGADAAIIENVTAASGGSLTGTGYLWWVSPDGISNWTAIAGATNAQYLPWKITQTTYYKRESYNNCSYTNPYSNIVAKTVISCNSFSTAISGPNPIIPGQQNAVYRVPNQTGFRYEWSITGGTIISGQNTNTVTVDWDAATGNTLARTTIPSYAISVTETNPDGQKKTTTATINTVATSIVQSLAQSGIKLFPNPTAAWFSIEMPESNVEVSYEILDLTGVLVASGSFTSTGSDQKIAADFGAGMYQVVLTYNDTVTTARLSKVQ